MRTAQIRDNKVINVIEAGPTWVQGGDVTCIASDTAGIGWVLVGGELVPPPIDFITEAEIEVATHFSTARLLQCKVWLDILPHENTPKLMSLFAWTAAVTAAALQESKEFPPAPVTFLEVAQECIPQLV